MITESITKNIYDRAYIDHSLVNEAENGIVDTTRVWWVQAEAVVGFINGWQKCPDHMEYLDAAKDIWNYISTYLVDNRAGSEWYWALDKNRKPMKADCGAMEMSVSQWKNVYRSDQEDAEACINSII